MLTIIQSIILGLIQGITEFIPVSSSAHLAIIEKFWGIQVPVAFNIVLHVATLIAILIVFWKDIINIIKEFFSFKLKSENFKVAVYIIIACIFTAIIGFSFKSLFKSFFTNLSIIGFALLITTFFLFMTKIKIKSKNLNFLNSVFVGISQGLALIPGISRSGSTISTGLILGIPKEKAIKFSFLIAIPAIIGAMIFEFKELTLSNINFVYVLVGFLIALIISYIFLKLLIKIVQNQKLHYFAYYTLALGLFLIIYSLII